MTAERFFGKSENAEKGKEKPARDALAGAAAAHRPEGPQGNKDAAALPRPFFCRLFSNERTKMKKNYSPPSRDSAARRASSSEICASSSPSASRSFSERS